MAERATTLENMKSIGFGFNFMTQLEKVVGESGTRRRAKARPSLGECRSGNVVCEYPVIQSVRILLQIANLYFYAEEPLEANSHILMKYLHNFLYKITLIINSQQMQSYKIEKEPKRVLFKNKRILLLGILVIMT